MSGDNGTGRSKPVAKGLGSSSCQQTRRGSALQILSCTHLVVKPALDAQLCLEHGRRSGADWQEGLGRWSGVWGRPPFEMAGQGSYYEVRPCLCPATADDQDGQGAPSNVLTSLGGRVSGSKACGALEIKRLPGHWRRHQRAQRLPRRLRCVHGSDEIRPSAACALDDFQSGAAPASPWTGPRWMRTYQYKRMFARTPNKFVLHPDLGLDSLCNVAAFAGCRQTRSATSSE